MTNVPQSDRDLIRAKTYSSNWCCNKRYSNKTVMTQTVSRAWRYPGMQITRPAMRPAESVNGPH